MFRRQSPFAALLLSLALLGACGKTPQQWLNSARASAQAGKHEQAVAAYDKALEQPGPHVSAAQFERAQSLFALKRWDEAARSALASAQGQPAGAARPARVLALRALAEAGDKAEGARVLAMLGADALGDPVVSSAAHKLGLGAAPAANGAVAGGKPLRHLDLARVNAVQVDIAAVSPGTDADAAALPQRVDFQDPRTTVKVPSPDGKYLIWRGLEAGKGYFLYLSKADGSGVQRLDACKNGYQPVWSPDGRKILFSAMQWGHEERSLFVYDLAAKSARLAFKARYNAKVGPLASWSPDGSKIVFTYHDELWITNANGIGRGMLNLGGRLKMKIEDARFFAWSKDGGRLAYAARDSKTVYLIDLTSKI